MVFKNDKTAKSASVFHSLLSGLTVSSSSKESISSRGNFHTIKKASPKFLFDDPWWRSASEWTISAIWFTNLITSSSNARVASAKPLISQKPKIASSLTPAISGLKSLPISDEAIFLPIILAPASPNHSPRSLPIVNSEDSKNSVSLSEAFFGFLFLFCDWTYNQLAKERKQSVPELMRLHFRFLPRIKEPSGSWRQS